jgi:hypothetical protein
VRKRSAERQKRFHPDHAADPHSQLIAVRRVVGFERLAIRELGKT